MKMAFSNGVNKEHVVKLESKLIAVQWVQSIAYAGQPARFQVRTACVGNQAPVKVTGSTVQGKNLGKVSGVIRSNQFNGSFDVPEDIEPGDEIYLEVKLKKNSLEGESLPIPVRPVVTVSNMKWDKDKVARGDLVEISAEVRGLSDGETVGVRIYEYDTDGAHCPVAELEGAVRDSHLKLKWVFEYLDNTEDIPDNDALEPRERQYEPPKYFFTVRTGSHEFGRDRESGLLTFEDWLKIELEDEYGEPLSNTEVTVRFADGSEQKVTTDDLGRVLIKNSPPGTCTIEIAEDEDAGEQ